MNGDDQPPFAGEGVPKTFSQNGLEHLKHFEGFRPCPYQDSAGVWTIGYGHTGPDVTEGSDCIMEREAETLLMQDVQEAQDAVNRLITVPLDQARFDALVSFTYNLGAGALEDSTLRDLVNKGRYAEAAQEFPKWVYAGGRKLAGLERRRRAEQRMFKG